MTALDSSLTSDCVVTCDHCLCCVVWQLLGRRAAGDDGFRAVPRYLPSSRERWTSLAHSFPRAGGGPHPNWCADGVLQRTHHLQVSADAVLQRTHRLQVGADAVLQRIHHLQVGADAVLQRIHHLQVGADAVLQRIHHLQVGADALLQRSLHLQVGADAVLQRAA